MSFQQYVERILSTTLIKVTNEVLYSPDQTRTGQQVLIPYPTALAPPSFPSRPNTSILIQRMSFGQYHRTTTE